VARSRTGSTGAPQPSVDRRLRADLGPVRAALVTSALIGTLVSASVVVQAFALADLLAWAVHPLGHPVPGATIAVLAGALGARAVLGALGEGMVGRSATRVTAELRRRLLSALVAEGPLAVTGRRSGAIVLTATRGLRSLEAYISRYLPAAMAAAVAPVMALTVLAVADWPSALLALALVAAIPVLMIKLGRRAAAASDREWSRLASLSTRSLELFRGLPTLRALGRVDHGRTELTAASEAVAESIDATLTASLASGAALEFIAGVGVGLVAMLAGLRLLRGDLSLTTAFAVILVTPEVFLPLRRAGAEFHASTEGRSAADAIYELLDATEVTATSTTATIVPSDAHPLWVEGATFRYPGASSDATRPITVAVGAGEHLVVRGASGSGKSTLLAGLAGLLAPSSGSVTVAGHALATIEPGWWHRQVALVPQEPHVFATTVRDNLCLGTAIEDEALRAVLDLVGLTGLVEEPGGLDRVLGEAGTTISAGERQRLGLARALLLDRPIVLLDEATSHLDAETIARLRGRLEPWFADRTVVEVSHRPQLARPGSRTILVEAPER